MDDKYICHPSPSNSQHGLNLSYCSMPLLAAPTAGPQQLMGSDITPRSITITWDPPPLNMTNGMIRSYIVRYFPSRNASEEPNDEQSIPGNMTSFMIADLDPFISYTFEVLAVTVDSGPSASITIMTEEAGKHA